jgi:hypothetical protein
MRNLVLAASLLLLALPLSAQQQRNAFHVFVANPSFAWSEGSGDQYGGSLGVAYQRRVGRAWAFEVAAARDVDRSTAISFDSNGNIIDEQTRTIRTIPIDLGAMYLFQNDTRWKPYLGTTLRWTEGDPEGSSMLYGLTGGVVWQFSNSFGLRFDGKLLTGDRPTWLNTFNSSAGLSWRF